MSAPSTGGSALIGAFAGPTGAGSAQPMSASIAEAMAGGLIGRTLGEDLDRADRQRALEAEYRAIEKPAPVLTEEQRAGALAYVVIGHDGQPRLHEQLYV
ncbi:MAG: hypothetical protein ACT6Q3_15570, partial [Sphingopyxis sp.]